MDVALSHEGDLLLNATARDLRTCRDRDELLQSVALRVKSVPGDFALEPQLGTALDTLVGQFLTPATLRAGEALLLRSLSDNPLLIGTTLTVRGVPVTTTQAIFLIAITSAYYAECVYTIPFDFVRGIVSTRTATTIGAMS